MKQPLLAGLSLLCCCALGSAIEFAPPVRLQAGGTPVRVEPPGYAAPCLADINGDGKTDLRVGQFNQGKIQVCQGLGGWKFAKSTWLQAEGKVAEVPGVW
jgi:hypothetical protein